MDPTSLQQTLDTAMQLHAAGRLPEAEALYRQLLALRPGEPDVIHLLGVAAGHAGRHEEGHRLLRQVLSLAPDRPHYWNNLGLLLIDWKRFAEAVAALQTARQLAPDQVEMAHNLGFAYEQWGQWEKAIPPYRAALALHPRYVKAWLNLGNCLSLLGRSEEAAARYREALRHCPGDASLATNLGSTLQQLGQLDEAIEAYRAAVAAPTPGGAGALLNNLAVALQDRGELDAALAVFRRALAAEPSPITHSNLIFALLFDPACTPQTHRAEEQRWNQLHAAPLRPRRLPQQRDRATERRLRIGWVSPDLRDHSVGRALLPVFTALDPAQTELFCYQELAEDAVSAQFRARADHWRSTSGLDDPQLAAQIQADGIDIVIDLALHTSHNRLPALAFRPAPVQIAWLGYPGPTGLETIDGHFTDRFLHPPDAPWEAPHDQPFHLETCWCYAPPTDSPPLTPPPFRERGQVTFGCSNQFSRVNARMLDLWGRILQQVASARLVLVAPQGRARESVRAALAVHGVAPQRVEFLPKMPRREFLARHRDLDIALDTFPYNGPTTSLDALWMGVPVVSRTGAEETSRGGLSVLSHLGLPELAASTDEDYVRIAVELAGDPDRLTALRATLRRRLQDSPLADAPRFARNLENALRTLWREWCAKPDPSPRDDRLSGPL